MATFPIQLVIEVTEQYEPGWANRLAEEDPAEKIELVAFVGQERQVLATTRMNGYDAVQRPRECLKALLKDVMEE